MTYANRNRVILLCALLLQLALLGLAFPLPGWEPERGLFHIDHPFHLYQVSLGRALLEQGSLVGYDPFFGGGNLGGVTFNVSAKLPVLFSLLVPKGVSTETLYLYYVFLCGLIAPFSLANIGVRLCWSGIQTAAVALLGTLFWWVSSFHWYHTAGMASFVCACYTSIPYSAWVFQILDSKNDDFPYARVLAAGALGGLGLWLHPLFGVLAGIMISGFLFANHRELKFFPILARGTAIAAIALALNMPWILAMRAGDNMLEVEHVHQIDVGIGFLTNAVMGVWGRSMGSLLNPLVVALGLMAVFLTRAERRRELLAFVATGCALLIFASFGATIKFLAGLQPNRFLAPGFLTLGIAASYAIPDGILWLRARRRLTLSAIVLIGALLCAAVLGRELVREVLPGAHGRYGKAPPEVTLPPESVAWLVSWIEENTSADGRILFETSLARMHGGGHIAGYLALRTRREFIGAPYPFLMPERSFWDMKGFGRPLADLTTGRFIEGLNLYNVGWIIAHSDELKDSAAKLPQAHLLAEKYGIHIFGIDHPLSYFQAGNARVDERGFNRMEVTAQPGSTLIMRYQWTRGISTTPASKIEPISLSPVFPPFIEISDAPAHFQIHMK